MPALLKIIEATFSRELVGHLAARLGESQSGVSRTVNALLPLVMGGIINGAGNGAGLAIHEHSLQAFHSTDRKLFSVTDLLGIMGSSTDASGLLGQGERLLATLFNASDAAIAEAVGSYAGIRAESAGTVLRLVGAVLPALLGQYVETHYLRPQALAVALLGLRNTVRGMLPRGLTGLTEVLWPEGMGTATTHNSLGPGAAAVEAPVPPLLRWHQIVLALIILCN